MCCSESVSASSVGVWSSASDSFLGVLFGGFCDSTVWIAADTVLELAFDLLEKHIKLRQCGRDEHDLEVDGLLAEFNLVSSRGHKKSHLYGTVEPAEAPTFAQETALGCFVFGTTTMAHGVVEFAQFEISEVSLVIIVGDKTNKIRHVIFGVGLEMTSETPLKCLFLTSAEANQHARHRVGEERRTALGSQHVAKSLRIVLQGVYKFTSIPRR